MGHSGQKCDETRAQKPDRVEKVFERRMEEITVADLNKFVLSLPNRIKAVLAADGMHTKY